MQSRSQRLIRSDDASPGAVSNRTDEETVIAVAEESVESRSGPPPARFFCIPADREGDEVSEPPKALPLGRRVCRFRVAPAASGRYSVAVALSGK